ncbi:hypothetical protein IGI04_027962 [Brassica rapa subsp. trilocularis]|uniref:F-box domain-containing protein n=1 Tax=Brassica rapa subsp. trilocularis TaxID=1813537 RepID=A0ABQ7L2X7_BRACM|nr:hypothetical protein IGI04_027962 [Brassica rapa subsp. trilocularis]
MTTMLDLPEELIDDIFSRVPSESVRAARSTCKAWNVTSEEARESGESRMIMIMDHNVYLKSIVVNENPSIKRLGKLTCLTHGQVKISQVFHCDGLLLCILKDDKRLLVWNPCLGQTRWIEKGRHADVRAKYKYAIGYGYEEDSCRRHYKILRGINLCGRGVSLKGNTYWCVADPRRQIAHTVCFDFTRMRFGGLQNLPFAPYRFKQLVILSCVRDEKLSVLLQSWESLVVDIWVSDKIDEQKVLWSKFLRVCMFSTFISKISDGGFFVEEEKKLAMILESLQTKSVGHLCALMCQVSCRSSHPKLVQRSHKLESGLGYKGVVEQVLESGYGTIQGEESCNWFSVKTKDRNERSDTIKVFGEDGYFRELDLGEPSDKECWPLVCPYVPSFVQIKTHKSSSEKRRYDNKRIKHKNK